MNSNSITSLSSSFDVTSDFACSLAQAVVADMTHLHFDGPDILVLTTAAFHLVRERFWKDTPPSIMEAGAVSLFGIRIEHYATEDAVHARCRELMISGKRVGMICE